MSQSPASLAPHVPTKKGIEWKDTDKLLLDPENPRLLLEATATQPEILQTLVAHEVLEELAASIARHGFFLEEPLIVVPHTTKADHFTVVEGNRRLATVKLLLNPRQRATLSVSDWPEPSEKVKKSLNSLPTVLYPSRDSVVPYLGFRHITGIKKWDYFQKARYIARLVEAGQTLEAIEDQIGDSASTVKKLYQIFVVHRQLENDLGMDTREVRENFSLLEVALSQRALKTFLGMPSRLPTEATESIIDTPDLPKLRELVSWIYGDPQRGQERVIRDSRKIAERLAPVIANEKALAHLRETRDLEAAYEYSDGERNYLARQLQTADRAVERALGVAHLFIGDEEIRTRFASLKKRVDALRKQLSEK